MGNNQNRRKRIKTLKDNYLMMMGCLLCGSRKELTFHHVNPDEKLINIGGKSQLGVTDFFLEMDKCVVLCMDCHKSHHKREFASERFK